MPASMYTTSNRRPANPPIPHENNNVSIAAPAQGTSAGSRLYTEATFHALFQQERKRTKRSGNPFVLVLVDIKKLIEKSVATEITASAPDLVATIEKALFDVTREHDSKGWSRATTVIGVIFTDIQLTEKTVLTDKILAGLRMALSADQMNDIVLSTYRFSGTEPDPDDWQEYPDALIETKSGSWFDSLPDLQKRTVDILGASLGIILFLPLFTIIAIIIKSTSKGPFFFVQERTGKNGKKFRMFKFRSMKVNNDSAIHQEYVKKLIKGTAEAEKDGDGNNIYKIVNDPRITPVGRFLRKTSLDELPQLFNVFKGEMSLVGPRPALPYEVAEYDPWHCQRVKATPGITGSWQVEGRSRTTFDEMVRMDIRYIRHQSLLLDLKLIFKTPFALLSTKGAL